MLSVTLDMDSDDVRTSDRDMEAIIDRVTWRVKPHFPRRGRMAWHIFENFAQGLSGKIYEAAKIKGVGVYNPSEEASGRDPITDIPSSSATPPTSRPLNSFATYPHLGFRPDGSFAVVYGPVSPVGGITLAKARREHEAARVLLAAGVPALAPLRVYRYDDLAFRGEPMGAVISAAPDRLPWRVSEAQHGAGLTPGRNASRDAYYLRLVQAFEIPGAPGTPETRMRLICALASQVGKRLRQYSTIGLFRYSAELQNFDFDFSSRQVLLTDLDSAEFLSSTSPATRRLEVMRDFASGLYHLLAKFATPSAIGHYSIPALLEHDPLAHFVNGYFGTSSPSEWSVLTTKLWNAFLPHFVLLNSVGRRRRGSWPAAERRTYKMDHHLFFILVMCEFAAAFAEHDTGLPGKQVDQDRLLKDAELFLGWRFGYLEFLRRFQMRSTTGWIS